MQEMSSQTPLMIQYQSIKDAYKNEVLFFRLGDFYEMFNDDAIEVSRLLNLTLTQRGGNPMCGIPYHASKIYIARLLRMGKKIAICEQVSQSTAGKGLAERRVVEVITPGTVLEEEYLEQGAHNFLSCLSIVPSKNIAFASFAFIDISTGEFGATSWRLDETKDAFAKELGRLLPKELVLDEEALKNPDVAMVLDSYSTISTSVYPSWHFAVELSYKRLIHQFGTANLRGFGLKDDSPEVASSGFLLEYLGKNTGNSQSGSRIPHVQSIKLFTDTDYVAIDDSSRRNLEIVCNLRDGTVHHSLLETVLHTKTAMGKRLLYSWFMYPLKSIDKILKRQEHVGCFFSNTVLMSKVRDHLSSMLDLERLTGRIVMERAHAKEIIALQKSLESWTSIRNLLKESEFMYFDCKEAYDIINLIDSSIFEDPSTTFNEARLIKKNWSPELDHLHAIQENFQSYLDDYLEKEKKSTGIQNLKIRYNRMQGYYMEVSRGKIPSVPSHFILKRALVNGDRYTTARLQELEQELLSADEKIIEMEKNLFFEVRSKIASHMEFLLAAAADSAYIDVSSSLAFSALQNSWVCPLVSNEDVFEIEEGRHPVVELHLPAGTFISNSVNLSTQPFALITGPNMAGKSTYLRQNALITLLAQIGSYVPAKKAHIGIVDKIFCRVGASDNLARGESTFLVEMAETSQIVRCATDKSLVIMDEVGRGTSTEDGLSIAWAVSEYLLNSLKCKTLFATHYHELSRLTHTSLQLLCLDVLEAEGKIIFLKKIRKGASENSYGIHVAQLAGIPLSIITRAKEILESLSYTSPHTDLTVAETSQPGTKQTSQFLFGPEELIIDEILSLDPDSLTPLDALQRLARWKKTLI
ncbi:MAG: DNA mismatch repair protein MutS [Spirochaetaceae bacterium]|nr:DNA mismatch repair protein MutS [Spirochaetaceae bacterium]